MGCGECGDGCGGCEGGIELLEEVETDTQLVPQYKVLLHNDDHNNILHVVTALIDTFKFEHEKAVDITLEAHEKGVAICRIEPKEYAELHCDKLRAYSLTSTIESAE
jgi:ATP-dependent Clp protease adaptor protein ClpS